MNARIDLAISAGLAEDPIEDPSPANGTHTTGRRSEGLLQQLSAMLAPLTAPRLQPCDCPARAHR
ncbi:hypothetical protein [Saccharopolyspora mangrovi]|uniref:Uncharacterized protein n=1 Tax=Saccharopolyspora mangrovi TaxID=3082379 RepID=A0ABU6A9Y6_9PSEU|nr:hypothetical protein [Saccharopolyspora sp. S2-29]MEB3368306.1 hypothetical protein [Saccharopolyspora sp. S2-29]